MTTSDFSKLLPPLFAIVALMVLGAVAMSYGHDGAIIASVVGSITGLGGYATSKIKSTPSQDAKKEVNSAHAQN